ncbi:hypothetical protein O3M35_000282 [Rhynocoris fuscipes]|uniref:PARP16 N-terminal domain-containing protein n=1 Tax=Rhynocoris fuscipes TaxID=488301 RepID=A0AAW1DL42_9HEMI
MEDDVRPDSIKSTQVLGEDVLAKEDLHRRKLNDLNELKAKNATSIHNHRSASAMEINSKSESYIVMENKKHQVNMIIPSTVSNQRHYLHCGDMEIVSKCTKRVFFNDEELLKRLKPCQDYQNKIKELIKYLENNLETADLKIAIYMNACDRQCLSPYPSYIIEESVIGMESLALINDFIPPVSLLQNYLGKGNSFTPNEHVVNVLHWLLITFAEPYFQQCDSKHFERILNKVDNLVNVKYPNRIFVFKYKRLSEGFWQAEKGEMQSGYAFLPINMEHAHSVSHLGVHPQIFTEGAHGVGLYLTTDLGYCVNTAPSQWVWGKSMLGIENQIILEVEFIKHPDVITYHEKKAILVDETLPQEDIAAAKWYFVPSQRLVRVRYLLLFVKTPPVPIHAITSKILKAPKCDLYNYYKHSLLLVSISLSVIWLLKRGKVTPMVKTILAGFSTLPLIRHYLSIAS